MRNRISAYIVALCLVFPVMPTAWAHGGGLDSRGCHRETATGGYHCHRGGTSNSSDTSDSGSGSDSSSSDAWKAVGAVVGGLLVLGLIGSLFVDNEADTRTLSASSQGMGWLEPVRFSIDESGHSTVGVEWEWRW